MLLLGPFLVDWVVDIPLGPILGVEEGLGVPLGIDLLVVLYPLGKVRVADEQPSKTDHVALPFPDLLDA